MTPQHKALMERFYASHLGPDWQSAGVFFLDGDEATQVLWPAHKLFSSNLSAIRSMRYDPKQERHADAAIEQLVFGGTWNDVSPAPPVWRVLLERHLQALVLCQVNRLAGNERLIPIPHGLPTTEYTVAAILWLQWEMKLPYKPEDRSAYEFSSGDQPPTLRRQ